MADEISRPKFVTGDNLLPELTAWWQQRIASTGDSPYANGKDAQKGTLLAGLLAASYGDLLFVSHPPYPEVGAALGALCLLLVFNFAHDASHGAVFRSASANAWLNQILFALMGLDGKLWSTRHLRGHHPFTNVMGADPDVLLGKVVRVTERQRPSFAHRWQLLYAPVLYSLSIPLGVWVYDFYLFWGNRMEKDYGYRLSLKDRGFFFLAKAFHLAFWVGIPLLAGHRTPTEIAVTYGCGMLAMSWGFSLLSALNHFSGHAEFPEGQKEMPTSWTEHQLRTNSDWCAGSYWLAFWLGGANVHVAHHLLPQAPSRHLSACAQKVEELAKREKLPYRNFGFWEGIRSHLRFLRRLSH